MKPICTRLLVQGFPDELDVDMLPDGRNCRLNKDFRYVSATLTIYTALRGLVSDGGSIPRFAWRAVGSPWTGKRRYAYVIHDALCAEYRKLPRDQWAAKRLQADNLLYEMCIFLGDSRLTAAAVYYGVRVGWYYEALTS